MATLDTYHVRATFLDTEPLPSIEASITAAPAVEGAYLKHAPFLFIHNDMSSGKIVKIRRIALRTIAGQGQTTLLPTNMQLNLISAITMDGETIAPVKMNSSASDLPSQVKIQQYASCTDTSGSEFRRLLNNPLKNMTRANAFNVTPRLQWGEWFHNSNAVLTEGIILREGEGITIHNTAIPFSMGWRIWVLFTVGTSTYLVSEIMRSVDDIRDLFTLYNGSSSGVVITVHKIIITEAGTDEVPFVALYRTDAYSGGTDLSVMKMDSGSSLPSSIKVRTEGEVALYGSSYGAIIANPKYRRVPLNTWGTGPGLAGVDMKSQLETMLMMDQIASVSAIQPVTLREGEGIALIQAENASGIGRWAVSVTFTVENVPASGGNTYSRGRVVNG